MFKVEIIESLGGMLRFEKQWTDLEKMVGTVHPLLKHNWLRLNWPEPLTPHFCLVFFNEKLVCILPAAIKVKTLGPLRLRIAMMGFSDPLGNSGADMIAAKLTPPQQAMAAALAVESLFSNCDVFDFRNIGPNSILQRAINQSKSTSPDSRNAEGQLITHLPATYEDFLASLSKSRRKEIRRKRAAADKIGNVELKVIDAATPSSNIEATFKTFLSMKQSRFEEMGIDGTDCLEELKTAHGPQISDSIKANDAMLFELTVDNRTMAISYYLRHNTRLFAFQAAFAEGDSGIGVGSTLDQLTIAYLIEKSSIKEIDWGPGGHEYKKSFSPFESPLINSFGFSSSVYGRFLSLSYRLKSMSNAIFRKMNAKLEVSIPKKLAQLN